MECGKMTKEEQNERKHGDYRKGTTIEISKTQSRVEYENKKRKVENRKNENERGAGGFV
jgi:hypothetical protein